MYLNVFVLVAYVGLIEGVPAFLQDERNLAFQRPQQDIIFNNQVKGKYMRQDRMPQYMNEGMTIQHKYAEPTTGNEFTVTNPPERNHQSMREQRHGVESESRPTNLVISKLRNQVDNRQSIPSLYTQDKLNIMHNSKPTVSRPRPVDDSNDAKHKEQVENAKYKFTSTIDDSISGNYVKRDEVRDGKVVRGSYSYDDGNIFRTVFYEADDNGFRIVKDISNPSEKTAKPDGIAVVETSNGDVSLKYNIKNKRVRNRS